MNTVKIDVVLTRHFVALQNELNKKLSVLAKMDDFFSAKAMNLGVEIQILEAEIRYYEADPSRLTRIL
jgi:hypothetical protein